MENNIALLRGINVGGRRKILMADLRQVFEQLGFTAIKTYIQSGNVIFKTQEIVSALILETKIEKAILDKFGFDVPVIIRSATELANLVANNPFYSSKEMDIKPLHLTFLKEQPTIENQTILAKYTSPPDQFILEGKAIFICCHGKYHQTKLTNAFFGKKLKVKTTTRNWRTVLKLLALTKEISV